MATPVAASLAALLWSLGASSPSQVESIMTQTSDAMPSSQAFCNGWVGA